MIALSWSLGTRGVTLTVCGSPPLWEIFNTTGWSACAAITALKSAKLVGGTSLTARITSPGFRPPSLSAGAPSVDAADLEGHRRQRFCSVSPSRFDGQFERLVEGGEFLRTRSHVGL